MLKYVYRHVAYSFLLGTSTLWSLPSPNQTQDVSPIHDGAHLPFSISITQANFMLPAGIHSGACGEHDGKWLFIAGRTNGLHGFDNNDDNFPPQQQNTVVYVVSPAKGRVYQRSLTTGSAGLTADQVNSLSVTSPQFYQEGTTLYITGGYGVNSQAEFDTKPLLTAIDIPGLISWVKHPTYGQTAAQYIRQLENPIFQVTGGAMARVDDHATLLIFGQNFTGFYSDNSNGDYTRQVRRFNIIDDGKILDVKVKSPRPDTQPDDFRRRDLNIVPCMKRDNGKTKPYLTAFSGVFTDAGGAWTIPVTISPTGHPSTENPEHSSTFKQGMNNYASATLGLFSKDAKDMYTILFGGISYGYFQNGQFTTDDELPFINQVTAIKCNEHGHFKQYLLEAQFPTILSTGINPGSTLLFGAGAQFVPVEGLPTYANGVFKFDRLKGSDLLLGYIIGGIQSTQMNTESINDSTASAYVFEVRLTKKS